MHSHTTRICSLAISKCVPCAATGDRLSRTVPEAFAPGASCAIAEKLKNKSVSTKILVQDLVFIEAAPPYVTISPSLSQSGCGVFRQRFHSSARPGEKMSSDREQLGSKDQNSG